jgi:diaminohydroxyphosphoribosylaminopyrimidine deaminase/5-amino-6-(5-phosphoribosylamino)uracil reductase
MSDDLHHLRRALQLAERGRGHVEPNPLVGCVIAAARNVAGGNVAGSEVVGEGWHQRFGGPHAEVEALQAAGQRARGATLYVTLEPCSHHGKTPPCADAVIAAGLARVVIALVDPFPQVAGKGIRRLQQAGIAVEVGLLEAEARALNAPYLKLLETGRPWVIAKWAMTLDGKLATRAGDSRWISNPASRAVAHALRGRVDAVIVGSNTARIDDPLLTARPPGPRTATRVIIDSAAALAVESRLVQTARQGPVLVAAGPTADAANCRRLEEAGCEVFICGGATHEERIAQLLTELGRRRMTNVLVEGGARLLGMLFDERAIDEVRIFIAPKLIGGAAALPAVAGLGIESIADALQLADPQITTLDGDVYVHGVVGPRQ